jgi:hypothetical protein
MLERQDIGTVESLRIDVLSETGWFDDGRFKADMGAGPSPRRRLAGGIQAVAQVDRIQAGIGPARARRARAAPPAFAVLLVAALLVAAVLG